VQLSQSFLRPHLKKEYMFIALSRGCGCRRRTRGNNGRSNAPLHDALSLEAGKGIVTDMEFQTRINRNHRELIQNSKLLLHKLMILMGLARRLDDRINRQTKRGDYLQKKTTT
jgi:hypothetical protein